MTCNFFVRVRLGRVAWLVGACAVLGGGVGLVLTAGLGSDGYSSLINGVARSTGAPYAAVNWLVGLAAVVLARLRGVRPGLGTIAHPVVVGLSVNVVLESVPTPSALAARVLLLAVGTLVLAVGVAGYLETGLGAGPFESATRALHPVPFRAGYGVLQAAGAVLGSSLGASIGVGTLIIVLGVGPIVTMIRARLTVCARFE